MQIHRQGTGITSAPERGSAGDVEVAGCVERESPSRLRCATVSFPPGARTSWKVDRASQTLLVTSGVGRAQSEGEGVVEIRAGDLVRCPPGVRHWDGAAPDRPVTYVALHEGPVELLDRVTDEQYAAGSAR